MSAPRVWSEREPGGWHDCVYSAALAMIAAAGFDSFPLGAFTDAEREAFERSQTIKEPEKGGNFPAADQAAANRYGVTLHASLDLAALLARPGLAIAVAGVNAHLPARLRRWDPSYVGGHAATVITQAPAGLLWLDPEAPMSYAGEPISTAELMAWWNKAAVRFLALEELAMAAPGHKSKSAPIGSVVLGAGHALISPSDTIHGRYPQAGGLRLDVYGILDLVNPTTGVPIDIDGHSPPLNGRDQVYDCDAPGFGASAYLLRADGTYTPNVPDCAGAVTARDAAWKLALAKVTP